MQFPKHLLKRSTLEAQYRRWGHCMPLASHLATGDNNKPSGTPDHAFMQQSPPRAPQKDSKMTWEVLEGTWQCQMHDNKLA